MTTTVLWQGHEVDAYAISNAYNSENTGAADATYERTGMRAGGGGAGDLYSRPEWAARNEIWHKFRGVTHTSAGMIVWAACRTDGTKVAQIIATDTGHLQYQALIGGALTNVGAAFPIVTDGQIYRFDIHHNGVAAGAIEVWYGTPGAQTKVVDATGDYSGANAITKIYHGCNNVGGGFDTDVAGEVVQDTSTLSTTSEIKPPSSNGTDVDGAGNYTNVNAQNFTDVSPITFSAAGQHQSFKSAARTHVQQVVTGVTVSCRAWYEAGGPTQIKPYVTIGAVRYYGTTFPLGLTALAYQYTFATNPSTGAAWTTADASDATLEYGWEAVA